MYRHLNESYIQWLESRGRSPAAARLAATFAFAMAALINSASLCFLIPELGGPPVIDWIGRNLWTVWAWTGLCVLGNALLSLSVPSRPQNATLQVSRTDWNWYMGITLLLWVVVYGVELVRMRSAPI